MAKLIKFGEDAKKALLKGMSIATEAIASTLGPRGNNVAFARKWGSPTVVHDGVTVAKEIDLVDPYENMGAQFIKEAASRTNDAAGDGTTTASILAESIATEANKNITAGFNPMSMRRGIELAVDTLVSELDTIATPIKTPKEVEQIAIISAQDEKIGKIVASAVNKMGKDGVIAVEESASADINIEYKQGMEFDRGFESHYFITQPETQEAILDEPFILITDKKISNILEFSPFIQAFYPEGSPPRPLVIISDEVSGPPLATLIFNKMQGKIQVLTIKAPSYGDARRAMLEDIAVVTGGRFVSTEMGMSLEKINESDLGHALRVTATKDSTIIVDGRGTKESIEMRIKALRLAYEKSESDFDREKLQERIAKLTTGIAVINVGANSEIEMREKKERIIDAISATKAAIDEGIVPGGETALLRVAPALEKLTVSDEESVGIRLVRRAIEKPFRRLMRNGGLDDGEMLAELRMVLSHKSMGVDQTDGKVKDLLKAGIIDPVKVVKSALRNAASIAIMAMTTDTLIVDEPEVKKDGDSL